MAELKDNYFISDFIDSSEENFQKVQGRINESPLQEELEKENIQKKSNILQELQNYQQQNTTHENQVNQSQTVQQGEGMKYYQVEAIRKKRGSGNRAKYLVKWIGYDERENTWEPLQNLMTCSSMVDQFEQEFKQKQAAKNKKDFLPSKKQDQRLQAHQKQVEKENHKVSRNIHKLYEMDDDSNDLEFGDICNKKQCVSHKTTNTSSAKQIQQTQITEGSIQLGDTPMTIGKIVLIDNKIIPTDNSNWKCLVDWYARENGVKPKPSYINYRELKKTHSKLILDFFELFVEIN